ncbi:hypothetical protein [Pararhizobium sp. O133]|uniref:hypothetical protein n=1 Tax=Pararhizobium sp. O133 TaxID=3449278 RepID=UPI003F68411A
MAANRTTVLEWLSDRGSEIITDAEDLADLAVRIEAAGTFDATAFALEMLQLTRMIGESASTVLHFERLRVPAAVGAGDTQDALTVLVTVAQAIAAGRVGWPSRPAARQARTILATSLDDALAILSPLSATTFIWLSALAQIALRLLSEIAANSAPIIIVQTGVSLPSTALAYHLYGDANRAGSLVDIARSATPMIMPAQFEAISS